MRKSKTFYTCISGLIVATGLLSSGTVLTGAQPENPARSEVVVETFNAGVLDVLTGDSCRGVNTRIITLVLNIDGAESRVVAGTTEFLTEKNVSFAIGDQIRIRGYKAESPCEGCGSLKVRVSEITKGNVTFSPADAKYCDM